MGSKEGHTVGSKEALKRAATTPSLHPSRGSTTPRPRPPTLPQLYDLKTDPFQRVNLAQQAGMSGLVALLSEQLWRIANCTLDSCP